jgi:ribosome silencing factor RsfS/YbeB/iojap
MTKKNTNNDDLLALIIKGIEDVKGNDINILDLREIENTVCDYFVICNGNSNTQVNAIIGSIQKVVSKELKEKPWHVEGEQNGEWVYQKKTPKRKSPERKNPKKEPLPDGTISIHADGTTWIKENGKWVYQKKNSSLYKN